MPPVKDKVENLLLKPYEFHGLDMSGRSGANQATGLCPFCMRDGKLYVSIDSGQFECKICTERGNIFTFLKRLYEESKKVKCDYEELAAERKIISPNSLEEWGLVRSIVTNEWMLPGYVIDKDGKAKIKQLYLWRSDAKEKRMRFIAQGFQHKDDPAKTTHGLYLSKWNPNKSRVYVLEGMWDGIAFDEILQTTQQHDDGSYSHTRKLRDSLFADANVIATPGANVFYESWSSWFSGKEVVFLFDNDHTRKHPRNDTLIEGSGLQGIKRNCSILSSAHKPPSSISYIRWGAEEQWTPDLPSRYDVRDHLSQADTDYERVPLLGELLDKIQPVPDEWKQKSAQQSSIMPCCSWEELLNAWKKAMYWNDGLNRALPFMLAVAVSTPLADDQLWGKVVSPPSTGKTELAHGLGKDEEHVRTVDIFRGLHSGVQTGDGTDASLISELKGKCLIITDADTVMQGSNQEQVMSEFRRAYDRNSSTAYRNGVAHTYKDWSFSTIFCGTHQLDNFDESGLGQRCLDCVLSKGIDDRMESSVNMMRLDAMDRMFGVEPIMNGKGPSSDEKRTAQEMTGGYLSYLLQRIGNLIKVIASNTSRENKEMCSAFAKFVAFFRARPSDTETEQREQSTRLAVQHYKLAYCTAAVLGKQKLDNEVMTHVRQVCLDTARGTTLKIAIEIAECEEYGIDSDTLSTSLLLSTFRTLDLLKFMRKIGIVEQFRLEGNIGLGTRIRYRLTPNVSQLFDKVMKGV